MIFGVFLAAASATAAVPSMATDWWSDYYDTPTSGVVAGGMSLVVATITVNKHGGIDGCVGHVYAGNPQMGPYVCSRLKMRGVFDPARGPDGQKVVGIYRKAIFVANVKSDTRFRVPDFAIEVPAPAVPVSDNPFEIQFYLSDTGQVSDCSLVDSVGLHEERHKQVVDPATVQLACAGVSSQLKPVPPRDKNRRPVPTAQNALVIVNAPVDIHNQ